MVHKNTSALERLNNLLREKTILYSGPEKKIVDQGGRTIPWIFYNWGISLETSGASLMATVLLEELKTFQSKQIASYGMTSLPILSSCIAACEGEYTGLAIRQKREAHGTCNQVEGNGDKSKPVVLLDDCLCSGKSLYDGIKILEDEGYSVEGCLVLVNFPWRGGFEWLNAMGYRTRFIFDVWDDLKMPIREHEPQKDFHQIENYFRICLPDHMPVADAVKELISDYLDTGRFKQPPSYIDQLDLSAGVIVSLRAIGTDKKIARAGIFMPELDRYSPSQILLLAIYKTIISSIDQIRAYGIENIKTAVSLLGGLKKIAPKNLDCHRHGILIQSTVQPAKVGGALPNTQFFVSEIEQLRQAYQHASISKYEPHTLWRYHVDKSIETGQNWSPFGSSIDTDESSSERSDQIFPENIIQEFGSFIRETLINQVRSEKFNPHLMSPLPKPVEGVGISIYKNGLLGCWTSFRENFEDALKEATTNAWQDARFTEKKKNIQVEELSIVISIFTRFERLGQISIESAASMQRLGIDSIFVRSKERTGLMLAHIPCHYNWSKEKNIRQLLKKAGISVHNSCVYRTYATKEWLLSPSQESFLLKNGYTQIRRDPNAMTSLTGMMQEIFHYLLLQVNPESAIPHYSFEPVTDIIRENGTASRILLAMLSMYHAAHHCGDSSSVEKINQSIRHIAEGLIVEGNSVRFHYPDDHGSAGAEALLLILLSVDYPRLFSVSRNKVDLLARRLEGYLYPEGHISALPMGRKSGTDQDILPGVILYALATYHVKTGSNSFLRFVDAHFSWYRNRFQLVTPWGMVWWHIQAWTAIHRIDKNPQYSDFVFELADWAIERQLADGSFLVDYAPEGPGFHTGCVLEGIADAFALAKSLNMSRRCETYKNSWINGMRFMDELIIKINDTYIMRRPELAIGGVRESLTSSMLRIDYSAHTLLALVKGIENF